MCRGDTKKIRVPAQQLPITDGRESCRVEEKLFLSSCGHMASSDDGVASSSIAVIDVAFFVMLREAVVGGP